MLVVFGLTVRFNVATESQPAALTNVTVCNPDILYDWPFHTYGSWFAQIVVFVVLVTFGLTVRLSVAMESQPLLFTKVTVYVPAAL